MTETGAATGLDRATVVALVAMGLGIFVIANDFTALAVVVVDIENDLGSTLNRAQWVINAYTVVFGVLIVTGGRLADLLGRRRVFLLGATVFATFSLLGGLAPNIELLIAARALMGIGGAMMWPAVLGMTFGLLPAEKAGLAGGLVLGVAGLGNAAGPLIAGVLTDFLDWRWVFFVNVPIALAAIIITRRNVSESRAGEHAGIDYLGIVTLSAAVILVLIALDVGTAEGFGDPLVLAMMVVGLLLLAVFAFVERRTGAAALLPRRVTASVQFTSAVVSVMAMSVVFFAVLVFVPQLAEKDQGWSALDAGAGLLPLMLLFAGVSFLAGRLYNRLGARVVVSSGAACLTLGVLWLAFTIGSSYALLVPGLVVVGTGVGLYYSAITTAAVTAVPASDNSLAGGIVYMAQIAGGSIGIGLNTAIVLSANTLADGIRTAFFVDAALGLVGTVVAVALIRGDGSAHLPHHRLYHRAHG
jgi:EmrB/QacA subfamily drug resistance transporter